MKTAVKKDRLHNLIESARTLTGLAIIPVVIGIALWWWAGRSQSNLDAEAGRPAQRMAAMEAKPGFADGFLVGHKAGLDELPNPNEKVIEFIARKHAAASGKTYSEEWGWGFLLGYREGLIKGWDEAGILK